jgi:hypothetical protein
MAHFFSFVLMLSLFFQLHIVHAQRDKVDSLRQYADVNNDLRDTINIRLYNALSWEYYRLNSYDTATYYVERALKLLEPLPTNHPTAKRERTEQSSAFGTKFLTI